MKRLVMFVSAATTLLALFCVHPWAAGQDKASDAAALLSEVRAKYLNAKTYRDEGVVKVDFKTKNPHFSDKPFSTAFERGGRFLWTYHSAVVPGRQPTDKYVVWSQNQVEFESWWDTNDQNKHHVGFDEAMAGPTGVSGGSAAAVIPLLRGTRLPSYWPQNPVLVGHEVVDGADCRIVSGTGLGNSSVKVWIDPDLAIRRIFEVREIDPAKVPPPPGGFKGPIEKFTTETTTELKPVFNEAIPNDAFVFVAPKG